MQIIVKADRGESNARHTVSCKMTCYHVPDEKTLQILSLHFVSTLQSTFCIRSAVCSLHFVPGLHFVSGLQSAVYILYPVCSL